MDLQPHAVPLILRDGAEEKGGVLQGLGSAQRH